MAWGELEVKAKGPTSAKHLWELLQDCWKTIPGDYLLKLIKRMPRVCKAVIKAKVQAADSSAKDAMREGPSMTSRSSDRDIITGPALIQPWDRKLPRAPHTGDGTTRAPLEELGNDNSHASPSSGRWRAHTLYTSAGGCGGDGRVLQPGAAISDATSARTAEVMSAPGPPAAQHNGPAPPQPPHGYRLYPSASSAPAFYSQVPSKVTPSHTNNQYGFDYHLNYAAPPQTTNIPPLHTNHVNTSQGSHQFYHEPSQSACGPVSREEHQVVAPPVQPYPPSLVTTIIHIPPPHPFLLRDYPLIPVTTRHP
ncbi:unnamed protein product [Ranitomeya imitator]|uniref:Uncharacterized protein n=1 Tax=Ranitomeya imitator TaxID=111125 RepID=A0ABN9LBT4_9NEOB|nr:unnamed protein product [Ranitomeya imitator]